MNLPAFRLPAVRTLALAALLGGTAARADTYTWDGASGPNTGSYAWSNPGNWTTDAAPPPSGLTTTDLIFGHAPDDVSALDTDYYVHSLTISSDATGLVFVDGTLTLGAGGLTQNSSGGVGFDTTPVILGADQTWTLASGTGQLAFDDGLNTGGYALTISAATTTGNGGNVVGGTIGGSGSLTKTGVGTLTLTGSNTYTGTTTVSTGVLQIGNGGTTGSLGTGAVTNNATLAFNLSSDATVANAISGTGNVTNLGAGTVTLSGAASYTGNTTVRAGTLVLTSGTIGTTGGFNTAASTVQVDGTTTATLELNGADLTVGNVTVGVSGSGTTLQNAGEVNAGTLTLGQNQGSQGGYTISGGSLSVGGLTVGSSGQGSFSQKGGDVRADVLVLGAENSGYGNYTLGGDGSTLITRGAVNIYRGTFTQNGGTFLTSGKQITVAGNFVMNGGVAATSTMSTELVGSNIVLPGPLAGVTQLGITGGDELGHFTQNNGIFKTQTLLFTSAGLENSYSLNGGTLTVGSITVDGVAGSTRSGVSTSTFNFNGGQIFVGAPNTVLIGGLPQALVQAGTTSIMGQGATNGVTTIAQPLLHDPALGSTMDGGLSFQNGTFKLTAANTFTGPSSITAGTLNLANALALQNSTLSIDTNTFGSGTVAFDSSVASHAFTLGGISGADDLTLTDNGSTPAAVALSVGNNNQNATYTGSLSGTGSLTKIGTGTQTLSGANTYTGGTSLNAGTLNVGSAGALGSTGTLTFNGGTLQYSANNQTDYSARFSQASGQNYRIDTNGQNVAFASPLYGGTSASTLTKLGAGSLTLTGASTYLGNTTVSAGTLVANNPSGSATGSGMVNVLSGATLAGNGTISGVVMVQNGGMLDPGAAAIGASRLTLGNNLEFNAGSTLGIELGGTVAGSGYSQVQVAGTLDLDNSNLRVTTINNFSLAVGQTFVIVEGTGGGAVNGMFADTSSRGTLYTDGSGDTFLINYGANTDGGPVANDVTMTVESVVPEPSTWALVGVGIAVLSFTGLRRKRHVTAG